MTQPGRAFKMSHGFRYPNHRWFNGDDVPLESPLSFITGQDFQINEQFVSKTIRNVTQSVPLRFNFFASNFLTGPVIYVRDVLGETTIARCDLDFLTKSVLGTSSGTWTLLENDTISVEVSIDLTLSVGLISVGVATGVISEFGISHL